MEARNQQRSFSRIPVALAAIAALTIADVSGQVPEYRVTDLGRLTDVCGINNSGEVAGTLTIPSLSQSPADASRSRAFLYSHGQLQDLGTFGGDSSVACGINDSGQIVGFFSTELPGKLKRIVRHGFLYADRSATVLPRIETADDINALGQIVGEIRMHAYVCGNGAMVGLGSLVERGYSDARRINKSGQVVGTAKSADGHEHAVLFSEGKMRDLGTLGGPHSRAGDINDSGQVVGSAHLVDGSYHAFLYEGGKMRDLGLPSGYRNGIANGINSNGQIVGTGSTITGYSKEPLGPIYVDSRAFLYSSGKWIDLNSRVNLTGSGLRLLSDATAINSSGQIVGKAMGADSYHAYLLIPIYNLH